MTKLAARVMANEHQRFLESFRFEDLTGRRFGRLTTIRRETSGVLKPRWQCICDCGQVALVEANCLTRGYTKSCGCLRRENGVAMAKIRAKSNRGKHWRRKARKAAA
jgi:hypothetical protein